MREILRVFPQQPVSLESLLNSLKLRGVNTDACYSRLIGLIEGNLTTGLVPKTSEYSWLSLPSDSKFNLEPLFLIQEDGLYSPNQEQYLKLKQHLQEVLSGAEQKLEDPLSFNL